MNKFLLLIFSFGVLSSFYHSCLADKKPNNPLKEIEHTLTGNPNITWVVDLQRTSGHLGNDPEDSCIKVYQFKSQNEATESCLNRPGSEKLQTVIWLSPKIVTIGGEKFDVEVSPDGCFASLWSIDGAENKNIVFKREPAPSSGCKS